MIKVSVADPLTPPDPLADHLPRSPRLAQVVRVLTQQIQSGHLARGQQLPPIRDLAAEHGLSFGSARAAVACLKRAGLVESMQGSGTFVKQHSPMALSEATRSPWVLVFVDPRPHVGGTLGLLLGRILVQSGIRCALGAWHVHMSPQELFSQCLPPHAPHEPRAIVVQASDKRRDQILHDFAQKRGVRVITMFRQPQSVIPGWHTVNPDYHGAYQAAARDLILRGHRRIGVVTKQRVLAAWWTHTVRKALMPETAGPLAVGRTLRDAGIRDGLTIHYNLHVHKDPSAFPIDEANLARMVHWLRQPNRPTAVITDDYRVPGVIRAAQRAGLRVPDDLSLTAVCGTLPPQLFDCPSVTLRYDLIAQRVADLVMMDPQILGPSPRHVVVSASWTQEQESKL